jgi:hypothetical protein
MALSAAASSRARPWSAANRSAANSVYRLIAASVRGQSTADSPMTSSTHPAIGRPWSRACVPADGQSGDHEDGRSAPGLTAGQDARQSGQQARCHAPRRCEP